MNHARGMHRGTASSSLSHVFLFTRKFESNVLELHWVTLRAAFNLFLCKTVRAGCTELRRWDGMGGSAHCRIPCPTVLLAPWLHETSESGTAHPSHGDKRWDAFYHLVLLHLLFNSIYFISSGFIML